MTIRLLKTEEEILTILPLLVELQQQHIESLPGLFKDYISAEHLLTSFKEYNSNFFSDVQSEKEMYIVFEENEEIIGCSVCKDKEIGDYDFENAHYFYIFMLTIHPQFRGHGKGKLAFTLLQEWAKSRGYKKIVLSVDTNNIPAISLYKKDGFRSEMMYMSKSL